jgi:alkaline phosphatase D
VSKDLFLDFWKVPPSDVRRTREGIYDSRIIGPPGMRVQIILLDVRWFRSPLKLTDQRGAPGKERYLPDPDPAKTMLGATQWTWLADELRKPAELRLLVSSIQVLAEGHGWERWGNFPLERRKLLDTIRESRAKGVVLLSGDRHIGALYREAAADMPPLYEATSSGINKAFSAAKEPGPNRLGALYAAPNFGVIDVDWWARKVTLALRDEAGTPQRSVDITFDELQLPR